MLVDSLALVAEEGLEPSLPKELAFEASVSAYFTTRPKFTFGREDGDRTRVAFQPGDFKSPVYTYSTTSLKLLLEGQPGFEPGLRGSKPPVLPLHHKPKIAKRDEKA